LPNTDIQEIKIKTRNQCLVESVPFKQQYNTTTSSSKQKTAAQKDRQISRPEGVGDTTGWLNKLDMIIDHSSWLFLSEPYS